MTSRGEDRKKSKQPSYRTEIQQVTQFLVCSESGNPLLRIHPADLETWRKHSPSGHSVLLYSAADCHRKWLPPRWLLWMQDKRASLRRKVGSGIAANRDSDSLVALLKLKITQMMCTPLVCVDLREIHGWHRHAAPQCCSNNVSL